MKFGLEFAQRVTTSIILMYVLVASYLVAPWWMVSVLLGTALMYILVKEWPHFRILWLTPLYPVLPFLCLIALNEGTTNMLLPFLFVNVASYDAGAYCVGKLLGSRKLVPSISPGKTWEGALGGFTISSLITYAFLLSHQYSPSFLNVCLSSLIINIASTSGDIFESYLKRQAGLKDAGSLLPGHGGLLDRFDGILGAALIVYPLRSFFIKLVGL